MTGDGDHLMRRVLDLDRAGRCHVFGALLASLDHSDGVDPAWLEDAHRRYAAIRAGEARAGNLDRTAKP